MSVLEGDIRDLQRRFWTQLLTRAAEKGVRYHSRCSPCAENFLSAGAGRTGLTFEYQVCQSETTAVQLYLSHPEGHCNEDRFQGLLARKSEIEEKLGMRLLWHAKKSKTKCCSVQYSMTGGGLRDAGDGWSELQERMIDTMDRFVNVIRPYIDNLPC